MTTKSNVVLRYQDGTVEPAVGAQVFVLDPNSNTTPKPLHGIGTTTDANGAFTLNVPDQYANEEIVIQYIGFYPHYTDLVSMPKVIPLTEAVSSLPTTTVYAPERKPVPKPQKAGFPVWAYFVLIPTVLAILYAIMNQSQPLKSR